ncbi:hypothetical protein [Streptomyces sp. NPDC003697]
MDEYAPGGLVPPTTMAELNARVVFVPLGHGPAVAARAARLALFTGVGADVFSADDGRREGVIPGWPAGLLTEHLS